MNKKILVGSIIAVAILVGISFTSVVGYRSVTSDVKESPLFTVRSSRAIDEESMDIACDYVGKGEDNFLSIPTRDSRTALVQKFIMSISRMSDENLEKLIAFPINHAQSDERFNDENFNAIKDTLYLLRDNSESIQKFDVYPINKYLYTNENIGSTSCWCLTFDYQGLWCFPYVILIIIMFLLSSWAMKLTLESFCVICL